MAAGDLHASFEQAVEWANEVFSVEIKQKADVVVSIARYPMDVDLYQSQKALDNGKWALKEGGTTDPGLEMPRGRRRRGRSANSCPSPRTPDEVLRTWRRSTSWAITRRPRWPRSWPGPRYARSPTWTQELVSRINIRPFANVQEARGRRPGRTSQTPRSWSSWTAASSCRGWC